MYLICALNLAYDEDVKIITYFVLCCVVVVLAGVLFTKGGTTMLVLGTPDELGKSSRCGS